MSSAVAHFPPMRRIAIDLLLYLLYVLISLGPPLAGLYWYGSREPAPRAPLTQDSVAASEGESKNPVLRFQL
jgi:hypothetical protein